ncbi:hypothetical protein MNBD_IGNAVI01-2664 [hydrothermal vent metagenome]|uniref:Uncharacterized protein n=1 Tax=hydrothermal vent metagenome TaxID=652676 RepID=A0A3B1BZ49_9ZZZZ
MELTYKDCSEFLRGFLVLVKKDNNICEFEKNMSMVVGEYFGFAEEFCEESIGALLENNFISEEPPIFSSKIIAEFFIEESYKILSQIHPLAPNEEEWLLKTAEANKVNYAITEQKIIKIVLT